MKGWMEHQLALLSSYFAILAEDRLTRVFVIIFIIIVALAIFGPAIAPYEESERLRHDDGGYKILESPSTEHPLGTTLQGQDVLSRLLIGAQPTLLVGLLGGILIITLGMSVALVSGFFGGHVDNILMRITDVFYALPVIPAALVLIGLTDVGFTGLLLVIGLLLWRESARVIRAQVLQIRERPFILASRTMGASNRHIIVKQILPNVLPMGLLFMALGVGGAILLESGLSFLGLTDPFVPTWGIMIRNAHNAGAFQSPWALAPGLMISVTVLTTFMIGRGFEARSLHQSDGGQTSWRNE